MTDQVWRSQSASFPASALLFCFSFCFRKCKLGRFPFKGELNEFLIPSLKQDFWKVLKFNSYLNVNLPKFELSRTLRDPKHSQPSKCTHHWILRCRSPAKQCLQKHIYQGKVCRKMIFLQKNVHWSKLYTRMSVWEDQRWSIFMQLKKINPQIAAEMWQTDFKIGEILIWENWDWQVCPSLLQTHERGGCY